MNGKNLLFVCPGEMRPQRLELLKSNNCEESEETTRTREAREFRAKAIRGGGVINSPAIPTGWNLGCFRGCFGTTTENPYDKKETSLDKGMSEIIPCIETGGMNVVRRLGPSAPTCRDFNPDFNPELEAKELIQSVF
ncbi:hypothetical protein Acr_00g0042130 [Actinidia rufa]|uniref:Uncharacterized protein n=1 Tax=Actinidia rufa TaxID=165716 RepID=A0A7J0DK17_9ERIC|nr:hypothetical protein Acr_00g0042130 [Actinidia rufa]